MMTLKKRKDMKGDDYWWLGFMGSVATILVVCSVYLIITNILISIMILCAAVFTYIIPYFIGKVVFNYFEK